MGAEKSVGNALDWLKWSVVVALYRWRSRQLVFPRSIVAGSSHRALLVAAVLAGFVAVQTGARPGHMESDQRG